MLFETKCLQQVVCEGVAVVRESNPVRQDLVNGEESTKEISVLADAMPRLLVLFANVYNSFFGDTPLPKRVLQMMCMRSSEHRQRPICAEVWIVREEH